MTPAEIEAIVRAELDRRGIPHPHGVSVTVKDEVFSPASAPDESILGRLKIGAKKFLGTVKAIAGTRIVKVTLWVLVTAIPTAQFYFPTEYEIAKKLAIDAGHQIAAAVDGSRSHEVGRYVVVNTEWKDSQHAYDADRVRFFSDLPTGNVHVAVTVYRGPITSTDFTISGSLHV